MKEIAEGGTVTHELALNRVSLWNKDRNPGRCPTSLPFTLTLPATFSDGKDDYVRSLFLCLQLARRRAHLTNPAAAPDP